MLEDITPVVLTFNEAPNIGRTLSRLGWARDIVVVDSFSDDETVSIARGFPQVRLCQRAFTGQADQWNYAVSETGIRTEWILALDADFMVGEALVEELRTLRPDLKTTGFRCHFTYCIHGRPLRASLLPPMTVLFRRVGAGYRQDGHTQRILLEGEVRTLRSRMEHDDRKPLRRWLLTQEGYMTQEAEKLSSTPWTRLSWPDRIRRWGPVAPVGALVYAYLIRGGVLDGRAGLHYALQRLLAEGLLSLKLVERLVRTDASPPPMSRG